MNPNVRRFLALAALAIVALESAAAQENPELPRLTEGLADHVLECAAGRTAPDGLGNPTCVSGDAPETNGSPQADPKDKYKGDAMACASTVPTSINSTTVSAPDSDGCLDEVTPELLPPPDPLILPEILPPEAGGWTESETEADAEEALDPEDLTAATEQDSFPPEDFESEADETGALAAAQLETSNPLPSAPPRGQVDVRSDSGAGRSIGLADLPAIIWVAGTVALWRLVAFLAPLFSRLRETHVIQHGIRASMLTLIQANPGIHVSEIRRRLGLAGGQTRHHLDVLESAGLVVKSNGSGYLCYYSTAKDAEALHAQASLLKSFRARFLLNIAQARPGVTMADAERAAGVKRGSFDYHLNRLMEAKLLKMVHEGRDRHLYPAEPAPPSTLRAGLAHPLT